MPIITVYLTDGTKVSWTLKNSKSWGWRIADIDGVKMLVVRPNGGKALRHYVPVANILRMEVTPRVHID